MSENNFNRTIISLIPIILIAGLFFLWFFIFINLKYGFELSDESYYCLATTDSLNLNTFASKFGLINYRLTFGCTDVYGLRIFKFMYQSLALLTFAFAFFNYCKKKFSSNDRVLGIISLLIIISGYANYDYLPQTLSYNSWSLIFSLLFWSAILFQITSANSFVKVILSLANGIILFLLFYVKAPNAVALFLFLIVIYLLFERWKLVMNLIGLIIGMLAAYFYLFNNLNEFKAISSEMLDDMLNIKHVGLSTYGLNIYEYFTQLIDKRIFIGEICLVALFLLLKNNNRKWICVLLGIVNIFLALFYFKGNSYSVTNNFTFILLFIINAFLFYSVTANGNAISTKEKIISFLFAITPFALAAGTNNTIFYLASHFFVYFIVFVAILLLKNQNLMSDLFFSFYSIFIGIFIFCTLKQGMVVSPYRQGNLSQKNYPMLFSKYLMNVYENR